MATPPPAKRAKTVDERTSQQMMGGEVVELIVGPEKKKFIVHKELLCSKVPYFEKMFKGRFSEATKNSAAFPEDKVECFDLLLGWVYNGVLRPLTFTKVGDKPASVNWSMAHLYSFANKICLPDLQDHALDLFLAELRNENYLPTAELVKKFYQHSTPGSGLRNYALALFRHVLGRRKESEKNIWPIVRLHKLLVENSDFLLDVITSIRNEDKDQDPRKMTRCTFHQHGDNRDCYLNSQR